jgi:hypothetical protein
VEVVNSFSSRISVELHSQSQSVAIATYLRAAIPTNISMGGRPDMPIYKVTTPTCNVTGSVRLPGHWSLILTRHTFDWLCTKHG